MRPNSSMKNLTNPIWFLLINIQHFYVVDLYEDKVWTHCEKENKQKIIKHEHSKKSHWETYIQIYDLVSHLQLTQHWRTLSNSHLECDKEVCDLTLLFITCERVNIAQIIFVKTRSCVFSSN